MSRDLCLREDVERELGWEPDVPSSEIGVAVKDGVVTLMGRVERYETKRAAERAAIRVPGVRALSSQLEVKAPCGSGPSDTEIAWAAAGALGWSELVPQDRIRPCVSNGWVTLEGSVDEPAERIAAEQAVAKVRGVTGVTNLIVVQPGVPAVELKERVEQALQRALPNEHRRIIVDATGDRVTLWGCITNVGERDKAEQAAWSAPGVTEVSNHLTIGSAVAAAR